MTEEKRPDLNLIVTRGGVPVEDQREGMRAFIAACVAKPDPLSDALATIKRAVAQEREVIFQQERALATIITNAKKGCSVDALLQYWEREALPAIKAVEAAREAGR